MTDNLEELERLLAKATPGEWSTDTLKSEGEYGSGPDTNIGFEVTAIYDDAGRALFDPLNSDAILVEEDYGDEDGYVLAYDAVSANNAALIVALHNAAPSLIATAREVKRLRVALRKLVEAASKAIHLKHQKTYAMLELELANRRARATLAGKGG